MKPIHFAPMICLLMAAPQASAQSSPSVDEQIQRLKGIPGTEEAIKQLEAHRAEIEKAQGAVPKQDTAPRAPVDIEPVHSFGNIPQPPKTAQEAFKRFGQVSVLGRDTSCDIQTKELHGRMDGWTQSLNEHALRYSAAGSNAGLMGQGAIMTELGNTAIKLRAELLECEKQFHAAAGASSDAYIAKLNRIEAAYSPKINACLSANERAGGGSCDYLYHAEDDELVAAGAPFLAEYNGLCADYREKLQRIAAEGQETLDKARKVLGAEVPPYADTDFTSITTIGMSALGDAVDAEDKATVIVHDQTKSRVLGDDAKRVGITD